MSMSTSAARPPATKGDSSDSVDRPRASGLSSWREEALVAAAELEALLSWIKERTGERISYASVGPIYEHIEAARMAAAGARFTLFARADLERARANLDAAEVEILRIAPESYVRGQLRVLVMKVRRLPLADARRTAVEELARRPRGEELSESDRSALVSAIGAANLEARRDLLRVRSFRNVLALTTLVLTAGAVGLAVVGMVSPATLPICFAPGDAVVCPTDSARISFESPREDQLLRATASSSDIALVELVGLLAAAIAAATALRRFRGGSLPYQPVVWLALLKLPMGALTAVLGLLLIRGGFIPGFTALDSAGQILAWAAFLGFGQQLFTRLIDMRAQEVLEEAEHPAARETAGLDTQTAEAFTTAVDTSLRRSAPRAFRDLIVGQPLVNFSGSVTLEVRDSRNDEVPIKERRVVLTPGEPYLLRVALGHERRAGFAMVLHVTDGVEDDVVRWTIELDSDDKALRAREQVIEVGTVAGEGDVEFPLSIEGELPRRWLWVRIGQREQIVLQVELEVVASAEVETVAADADR